MMMESEIARLLKQIEAECAAMQLALSGYAAVAKHEIIAHRFDAIGQHRNQLATLVGDQEANTMTWQTYNKAIQRHE
jgi:hypothetical protein